MGPHVERTPLWLCLHPGVLCKQSPLSVHPNGACRAVGLGADCYLLFPLQCLVWFHLDLHAAVSLFPAALYWETSSCLAVHAAFYRTRSSVPCHNTEFTWSTGNWAVEVEGKLVLSKHCRPLPPPPQTPPVLPTLSHCLCTHWVSQSGKVHELQHEPLR